MTVCLEGLIFISSCHHQKPSVLLYIKSVPSLEDIVQGYWRALYQTIKSKTHGHFSRLSFAFQQMLVSIDCNYFGQLCVWSIDTWEKRKSVAVQIPSGKAPAGDTRVQFHSDQIRLLVVHETQLAIYDTSKMDRIRQVGSLVKCL